MGATGLSLICILFLSKVAKTEDIESLMLAARY
jgi:hypothetical protein